MRDTSFDTSTFFAPEVGLISSVDPFAPLGLPTTARKAEIDQRLAASNDTSPALPGYVRGVLERPERRLAWHLLRAGTLPHNGLTSRGNRGEVRSIEHIKQAAMMLEEVLRREHPNNPSAASDLWPSVNEVWSKLSRDKDVERLLIVWAEAYGLPEPQQTARRVLDRVEAELLPILHERLSATGLRKLPATFGGARGEPCVQQSAEGSTERINTCPAQP